MSARTLVLDISYTPHKVISWQRAVSLIFDQKAEVIECYDEPLMTPDQAKRAQSHGWTMLLKMPAVVRLLSRISRRKAVRFSRMNVLTRDSWQCQYCLAPDHKVLTTDLRWVSLGDVQVGDNLIGFEEERQSRGGRQFQESLVETHDFTKAELFKVTLDDGTSFQVTGNHKWLGKSKEFIPLQWFTTTQILGKLVPRLFNPWVAENTYEAGWLAGILDGEGWVTKRGMTVAVAQNPGLVLEYIKNTLQKRSFEFSQGTVSGNCQRVYVKGTACDKARLLGQIRPRRLLEEFRVSMLGRLEATSYSKVLAVEPAGIGEIVQMKTSSGTFLADGLPHHNCGRKLPTNQLNYDHVVPRSQGGKTVWENIVTSCYDCNARKENKTPQQAKMKLLKQPVKPKSLPLIAFHVEDSSSIPECWQSWLYWNTELEHD